MAPKRRARRRGEGFTLVEFIVTSSIATVLSATVIFLMTGARDAFQTHTTMNQLSGYVDVATTVLRKDFWEATAVGPTVGGGICPNDWLRLTNATRTIVYCLDNTDPNNTTLRRTVTAPPGAPWNVAQFIVAAGTTVLLNNPRAGLHTVNLQTRRTVNGRQHMRTLAGLRFRMQLP